MAAQGYAGLAPPRESRDSQRRSGGEVIYSLALPAVRDLLASARAILETKAADQGGLVDDITPAAALQ